MKVVLLIDSLTQGGAQRQIVGLAKLLKEHGQNVLLLTYHDIPFYAPYLDEYHVAHRVVENVKGPLKRIWRVCQELKQEKSDVVISYLDVPNMLACLAKMMGVKAKLIVSERNTTQHLTRQARLRFYLYRWANHVVPNSLSQAEFIAHHYPSLLPKVTTISNFVDLDVFKPAAEKKTITKQLRIIGAGRIEPQKNILRFIKAVALARQKGCDVRVDWYGRKSRDFNQYEQAVKECHLVDCFFFQAPTNDIVSKYQQSDLFCLPSLYEGYPNVLCEAMSSGLPVICSDVCDNARIMEDGKNGFLFEPKEVNSIADAIIKYSSLTDDEKTIMGIRSREIAENRFSESKFVEQYMTIIKN